MTATRTTPEQRAIVRPEQVLGELLRAQAGVAAEGRFLTCGERELGFGALDLLSDEVAAGLWAAGVTRGDRVAIVCLNRVEMVELFFGVAKLGAIQVPLNAFLKGEFLRYQLADCKASALVVDAAALEAVAPMLSTLEDLRLLVTLDEHPPVQVPSGLRVCSYAEVTAAGSGVPAVPVAPADLMSIVYTSGTTGQPKGCMLSHGYYARVGRVSGDASELVVDDVLWTALPLFHGAARMMILTAGLVRGLPVVIDSQFSVTGFLARAREVSATIYSGVGAMGSALLATEPTSEDRAHRLRKIGLVPFPAERQQELAERYGVEVNAELFGQTECVPVTYSPSSGPRNPASCGRAAPDLEVVLLDDDDRPVEPGQVGEICARPREPLSMFSGYWGKPEATVQASRSLWHHTGDYGRIIEDGFVVFVDRKKDAVRRRGENVSTQELEAAISKHQAIADVAVHAVPSAVTDDDIKACLVLTAGCEIVPAELFAFFKEQLPFFAIPRYVEILPELPRNAVARVLKHELRKRPLTDAVWDFEALGMSVARDQRR